MVLFRTGTYLFYLSASFRETQISVKTLILCWYGSTFLQRPVSRRNCGWEHFLGLPHVLLINNVRKIKDSGSV